MIRGSCVCGGVRFEFPLAVTPVGLCHCSLCRKSSGAASNASFLVPKADLAWLQGRELVQGYSRPSGWVKSFCRTCGSPVPGLHRSGGAWSVPAGSVDSDPGLGVGGHIFVASKAAWDEIGGTAPRFDEYPPGMAAPPRL